ncbi:hypothetical protein TNCV_3639131 [Trichonephila clavipes]|nr:hypothetical protein TNCV_3639131 [Trichonephila clavipes]
MRDLRSSSRVLRPRQFQEIKEGIKPSHLLPRSEPEDEGLGVTDHPVNFRHFGDVMDFPMTSSMSWVSWREPVLETAELIISSRLTERFHSLPPVYGEAWASVARNRKPQTPLSPVRVAAHGKHAGQTQNQS